jgi:hypothetical protein
MRLPACGDGVVIAALVTSKWPLTALLCKPTITLAIEGSY